MSSKTVTFIGGPLDLQRHVLDVESIRVYSVHVMEPVTTAYVRGDALCVPPGPVRNHEYDILAFPCYSTPDRQYVGIWREKWH